MGRSAATRARHIAEQGRALLDFLAQNDHESIYLDVGFPPLATGPAGGHNVIVRSEPFQRGYEVPDR